MKFDVQNFLFQFITCPDCNSEYHFHIDKTAAPPNIQADLILWSFHQSPPVNSSEIYLSSIVKCKECRTFIWLMDGVNSCYKSMEDKQLAMKMLDNISRPEHVSITEYFQLMQDRDITEEQRIIALREGYLETLFNYEFDYLSNSSYREMTWPPTPNFDLVQLLIPSFSEETDNDKILKAELYRNLKKYTEAISLLRKVSNGLWKRKANHMIRICNRRISRPVIIPPKDANKRKLLKWLNRNFRTTFHLNELTVEDYY